MPPAPSMRTDVPSIRDLLTAFSPSSDFFAISSGDGRIKVWDTVKGQLQTEFSDFAPSDESSLLSEPKRGHLSLDFTCMKWIQLEKKKKKKTASSILVLGTGSGDVLALDVAAGQLRWNVKDCNPGGVNAVSFSAFHRCLYTTGADGMVCQIDASTGSLVGRFRSFSKTVSSMAISADGKILATAAGQLKTYSCLDNKKLQKFSGHQVVVRCMIFSEDGQYILSSGVGERHVAIWKLDGGSKQPASCILSMEHPAIFLDCKNVENDTKKGEGLSVLAISEMGVCYFWYGSSTEDLRNCQPTMISMSLESKKNLDLSIYAANLLDVPKSASGQVFVAFGSLVKPSFQKLLVQCGVDIKLADSKSGVLLPIGSSSLSQKRQTMDTKGAVTALDRANAEDAILPIPRLYTLDKKRKHSMTKLAADTEEGNADLVSSKNKSLSTDKKVVLQRRVETDDTICIEDRLKASGIILEKDDSKVENMDIYCGGKISIDENISKKKIRAHISSMDPVDVYKFLEVLISAWKKRSHNSKNILPWIYYILVHHGHFIISQDSSGQILGALHKMITLRSAAIGPLLKLSGRFQLIMTQIDKAGNRAPSEVHHDEGDKAVNDEDGDDNEDEEEDIDEIVYGEDLSSDEDDMDDDMDQT